MGWPPSCRSTASTNADMHILCVFWFCLRHYLLKQLLDVKCEMVEVGVVVVGKLCLRTRVEKRDEGRIGRFIEANETCGKFS